MQTLRGLILQRRIRKVIRVQIFINYYTAQQKGGGGRVAGVRKILHQNRILAEQYFMPKNNTSEPYFIQIIIFTYTESK